MRCIELEGMLNDFVDGTSSAEERRLVSEHLAGCDTCTQAADGLNRVLKGLKTLSDHTRPPADLFPKVSQRISRLCPASEPDAPVGKTSGAELLDAISLRQVGRADNLMANFNPLELNPEESSAAHQLGCFALWLDLGSSYIGTSTGYSYLDSLAWALERFPGPARDYMSLVDNVYLEIAEGVSAFYSEKYDKARDHFNAVLLWERRVFDKRLPAYAAFFISRCDRRQGRYKNALQYNRRARSFASQGHLDELVAVIAVNDAWLLYQQGQLGSAIYELEEAEQTLKGSDDHLTIGDIYWCRGRISELLGNNAWALDHFTRAANCYERCDPQHADISRTRVRMAFVIRLMSVSAGGGESDDFYFAARGIAGEEGNPQRRVLRRRAMHYLADAQPSYLSQGQSRGLGDVYRTRALLYMDDGRLAEAELQADEAYKLGRDNGDYLLTARARIVQCMLENQKVDQNPVNWPEAFHHADLARTFAMSAVEHADKTEHDRLRANAETWLGLTYLNTFFHDPVKAFTCYQRARAILRPIGRDHVYLDLQLLARKLRGAGLPNEVVDPSSEVARPGASMEALVGLSHDDGATTGVWVDERPPVFPVTEGN